MSHNIGTRLIGVLTSFHFGPHMMMGNNFEGTYVGYPEGFQEQFTMHIKNCFCKLFLQETYKQCH